MTCRRGGRVTDQRFGLPDRLVQLGNEMFEILKAAFTDLPEVFPEWNLQLLLQVGVFRHQHFHHHSECLTVLTVHLADKTEFNPKSLLLAVKRSNSGTKELIIKEIKKPFPSCSTLHPSVNILA